MKQDVAVVLTNFNHGRFIKDAINSIYTQTFLPKELVIVDDCSSDDSVKIIKETLHGRPKTIAVKQLSTLQNGGVAIARNLGIMQSKSPVIAFLDADDFYYPRKLELSLEVLGRTPEIGLVYTDYDVWDTRTNEKRREFKHSYDFGLLTQTCIVSTNSVVTRQAVTTVGGFNPQLAGAGLSRGEDYELWLRIAHRFMIYHVPEALFCYRLHGTNVTLTRPETVIEGERMWKPQLLSQGQGGVARAN